jgi:hypothetical protein
MSPDNDEPSPGGHSPSAQADTPARPAPRAASTPPQTQVRRPNNAPAKPANGNAGNGGDTGHLHGDSKAGSADALLEAVNRANQIANLQMLAMETVERYVAPRMKARFGVELDSVARSNLAMNIVIEMEKGGYPARMPSKRFEIPSRADVAPEGRHNGPTAPFGAAEHDPAPSSREEPTPEAADDLEYLDEPVTDFEGANA